MIKIPSLNENDMQIFKGKKILLYCITANPLTLYKVFKYFHIDVIGYCYEGQLERREILELKLQGLKCIKLDEVPKLRKKYHGLMVQSVAFDSAHIAKIQNKFEQLNIEFSQLPSGLILCSFMNKLLNSPENFIECTYKKLFNIYVYLKTLFKINSLNKVKQITKNTDKSLILICSPQKTADFTISYTFDFLNNVVINNSKKITYVNVFHRPYFVDKFLYENEIDMLRIIVGLREPISQNLSGLYQEISNGMKSTYVQIKKEISKKIKQEKPLDKSIKIFGENSNDVQVLWELFHETDTNIAIQRFIPEFSKYVLDITKYPFNKEKGYTIIKEGNIEVFVYQLEKLNNLVPELSEWVGVPFTELVRGNDASDKWIADSYKQAQKEIEITQEYFDRCYNEPYIQHCYSQADIEKFKERWRPHIK